MIQLWFQALKARVSSIDVSNCQIGLSVGVSVIETRFTHGFRADLPSSRFRRMPRRLFLHPPNDFVIKLLSESDNAYV